jgi:hypothetical protein
MPSLLRIDARVHIAKPRSASVKLYREAIMKALTVGGPLCERFTSELEAAVGAIPSDTWQGALCEIL